MDSMSFIENLLARKGEFSLTTFASYEADEVLKTACAFLNNRGGWIVVGIDKGKKLTSVDVKAVVKDIQIRAISQIKPLPLLYVHEEKISGGECSTGNGDERRSATIFLQRTLLCGTGLFCAGA